MQKPLPWSSSDETTLTSSESLLAVSQPPMLQIHLFKSQIILNPTISRINFAAYLLFSMFLALIVLPIALLQIPLLNIVYGLSQPEDINVVAISQLVQLSVKLLFFPWLGFLCDKYGRRPFVFVGIILLCTAVFFTPNLPRVFPYYYLVQIVQELGVCCMMTAPLLADYIDYETKGRVAGLQAIIVSIASFCSTLFTEYIDLQSNIPSKYHEIAITGFAIGFFVVLGLKGGAYHKALYFDRKAEEAKIKAAEKIEQEKLQEEALMGESKNLANQDELAPQKENYHAIQLIHPHKNNQALELIETENDTENESPGFMAGLREAKRHPWILIGYICGFNFFATLMLVNVVLVNYVTHIVGSEDDATQAYVLTNKQIIAAALSAIFLGFAADKYNKFKILIFVIMCSVVAVLLLISAPSPYHFMAYLSMVFFGVSIAGYLTFLNQTTSKYPNPKYRASVTAVSFMASSIGGAMISILGILLSKYVPLMPFYLQLGGVFFSLCILIFTYIAKKDIINNL